MTTEVITQDSSREWLRDRFQAMASEMVTTWDIAQDIAANWTEGRKVSELPECWDEKNQRVKYPGQLFREWLVSIDLDQQGIDRPSVGTTTQMLSAARIQRLAPPRFRGLPWSLYSKMPAGATAQDVEDILTRATAQPTGLTQRSILLVQQKATGMKPPYWQQVIENLQLGAHGLSPADARNVIATASRWLEDNG